MVNWEGIYNQSSVISILENFIFSNKTPHAFLFTGNSGVGKNITALRFAQNLNTFISPEQDNNHIVKSINSYAEPYIKYIFPIPRGKNETDESSPYEKLSQDELLTIKEELGKKIDNPYYRINIPKANNIKISSIRDIKKFVSLNFAETSYRIIIISDAHLMNDQAQNALLKNLEEPPQGIIFILLTSSPELLRSTIRSRCWNIYFRPLEKDSVKEILIKYFNTEEELAELAGNFSQGSVSTALDLLDNDLDVVLNKTISILRYSFGNKYHSALNEMSYFLKGNSSDLIKILISVILLWLNDVQKHKATEKISYFNNFSETVEKFNTKFPNVDLTEIIFNLDQLNSLIQNNINVNVIALNIIFELSALTKKSK